MKEGVETTGEVCVDAGMVPAERERLPANERVQAQRQAALLRLSAELAATLDETEVCQRVVDGLHDTLGYDFVALFLVDETTGDRVVAGSVGFVTPLPRFSPGQGLSEGPLLDGQLQYTPDVTQDPRYFHGMGGSEVDVPVRIGGKVLGVLITESWQPHSFNHDDFELLTAAAQQAGLAIEKARLLAAERRRADQLEALRTTLTDITAERELPTLLQAIVERAAGLLDATGGELGLYDEASQEIRIVVSYNLGEDYVGTRHALGEGAMGRVAETGEPLIIEDYHTWAGGLPQYSHVHSTLVAPLKVGGRLVGIFTTVTTDPARQFSPADLRLLNMFAQQAAIAVENARLFSETERRTVELATLTEVGKALSSTLCVDEVLQLIYEQTRRVMYAENMIIGLYDEARQKTKCVFSTDLSDSVPGRYLAAAGLGSHIVKHRESLLLRSNLAAGTRELGVSYVGRPAESWLGVPMLMGQRVLGVIIVQHYTTPNVYDESHQVLLETIAGQAAIAIDNARLYDQAQREIAERKKLEEEILRQKDYFEALFVNNPVAVVTADLDGKVVSWNPMAAELFGYTQEEAIGRDLDDLVANDDSIRAEAAGYTDQAINLERVQVSTRRTGKDGSLVDVELLALPVIVAGEKVGFIAIYHDISERKRAEIELRKYQEHLEELVQERTADLRESEARYRGLYDGVPVGLYRTTPAGEIVDANPALMEMLGYPSEEHLLAVNTANLYADPEDRVQWGEIMKQEGPVCCFEVRFRRYDGTIIWVTDIAKAVRDEGGEVVYYEGSIEDITKRKQAEVELRKYREHLEELVEERTGELRESEERYRTLFDGVPVGLYRSIPSGQVLDANLAFVQMAGYPSREDLLAIDTASFYVDPKEQVRWQTSMEREGVVRDSEYQVRRYDGTVIWISDIARAVKDKQGQVLYYEGSVEDITERRRAEHELRQAKEAAETANRAKSTFLANMSHELRTPLNAILGFTQLMDGDPNLTVEQQENLKVINRSGEHLLTLINDVLEMSKIEAGRVTLQERSFDLYALLDSLEEMFRLRTEDKSLELIFDRSPDVRQYVRADESKLRQVLMNLLSNAVKFTEEGSVTLRVGCPPSIPLAGGREEDKEEGCLVFEIEDTGPGIAPEELEAVFDPFVQTAIGQQSHEGTGLGLPISQQFTRLMGSDITVSSKLGQGSIFRFEVPIGLADAAEVQVLQPSRRVLGLEPGQEVYRLLIVDDREVTRELMIKLLRPLGFEVREAVNGQEGVEVWKQWQPHLIWMDMRMPIMDGYEATRRIKAAAEGQATAVVALTASAFEEDRETILSAGCDDVVRKPFRKDEIFDTLTKHLGVRFVYEGERAQLTTAQPAEAAASLTDVLTPAALAALPADWLADLQQATIKADLSLILTLVDQIRQRDVVLADALADLAYDFEYKKIMTLIEQAGG